MLTKCGSRAAGSGRIQIEDAALAILIYVADRLPHLEVRIFGEVERGQGKALVAGSAERAARLQHFDLHGVVGALEAGK